MKKVNMIQDGAYSNLVTGMGTREMDKSEHTFATPYIESNLQELARMKISDGIAAAIVEHPVETAFKEDLSIIGDEEGRILKEAYKIGLIDAFIEAGEYVRLCGGAIIVSEYEGEESKNLAQEPPKNARIKGYWVYSAGKVELNSSDFDGNRPKIFRVVKIDNSQVEIHPARCTVFKGTKIPDICSGTSLREAFFGSPALKKAEKSVKDLATVFSSVVNMAAETGVNIFCLEDFNEMLSKPDSGITDVQNLMSLVKLSMNSMRAVFAGANDKFQILSHNFSGLPEIIQKNINRVSADCRIPVSILFGQSASGLAQTNKGDIQAYCEMVESWRQRYLYRPMCLLIEDFARRNFNRQDVSEFIWGTVVSMSIDENLDAKKKQMEIVEKAITLGIITPEEARSSIFVNGHSWNISVKE